MCQTSHHDSKTLSHSCPAAQPVGWRGACCDRCGIAFGLPCRPGRPTKWCVSCRRAIRRERQRAYVSSGKIKKHWNQCLYCGVNFSTTHKQQKCCSTTCAHIMSRNRVTFTCAHCGISKEMCKTEASKRRFCSKECRIGSRPSTICAGCGRLFQRNANGKFPHQDKGKYCTRDCYLDHRWGKDRPRKAWSDSVRARASRNALATSLRKKCKILGVPYDAECTRQSVCERDGWQCQRCRVACNQEYIINRKTRRIHPRNAEHDHIIPLTDDESPGNVFPNSQCLCRRCNGKKRDTRWGQLRLDLEGSVQRWEDVDANRSRRNSKSSVAIQAVVP